MRRLLLILAGCTLPFVASAQAVYLAPYGVQTTFHFLLFDPSTGQIDTDEDDGGEEVSISCDEGAETTATNDFVDEGTFYSITLTAAEMQCARIAVVIEASDTNVFFVQTYGDASAQHEVFPANVKQMNDAEVCGDGDDAPWTGDCD